MGIALIVATIVGIVFHRLKQPMIVGYLLAGVIIGPEIGPPLIHNAENIHLMSEIGLIFLLFIIGLEMNPHSLLKAGRQLFVTGLAQFPISFLVGTGFFALIAATLLPFDRMTVVYLAAATSLSSTAIVVKSLYDQVESDTYHGRAAIGILIFQDIWAILLLVVQPSLQNPEFLPIAIALAKSILLLVVGFLFSNFALRHIFQWVSKNTELVVAVSIGWCAALGGLAGALGLSIEMGALIAGISISTFPYSLFVTSRVLPLRDVFLTIFFVALGMQIPWPNPSILWLAPLIAVFVIASRFLVVLPLIRITGGSARTGFMSSLDLGQISEFSLVIGSIGIGLGHIGKDTFSILLYSMAIVSIVSIYGIKYNAVLFAPFHRLVGAGQARAEETRTRSDTRPIVILGYHRGAQAVIENLAVIKPDVLGKIVVVDFNMEALRQLQSSDALGIFGDVTDIENLEHIDWQSTRYILSTIPDMLLRGTNNMALLRKCRNLAPDARIIVTADTQEDAQRLRAAGADEAIIPYAFTGDYLAMKLIEASIREAG
ncbi:MAG: cation:proton antiporter [Leptospirales bacterium]|nr:cation:proton antiporter [Leptospirales bacterium]